MATVTVDPRLAGQVVEAAGASRNLADYNSETQTLTCRDVTQAALDSALSSVTGGTVSVGTTEKRAKAGQIKQAALDAHFATILAADTVYQSKLVEITNATTKAELDAITYP